MSESKTPFTFTSKQRLLDKEDFQAVFNQASRFGNRCFTVLARENRYTFPRLGLAISKKCAKKAVDRNRLKRLFRESFRNHQHRLPAVDIIAMCKPCASQLSKTEARQQIDLQWTYLIKQFAARVKTEDKRTH